jgi:hypothetical protein
MKNPMPATAATARAAIFLTALGVTCCASWAAMTEPFISYTVKPRDTLQGLSRSLLKDPAKWAEVAQLNGMKNPNRLSLGQEINVPRSLLNLQAQPRLATPGKILNVQGDVKIGGQSVQVGASVPEGARIETGADSSAIVELGDGSKVQMMPKTLAEVTTQHGYAFRDPATSASTTWFSGAIRLVSGVLDTLANKQASRLSPLTVTTPTSVIGVRGTQFRVAFEDPASGISRTEVLEGKVQADNTAQQVNANLSGGFGAAINPKEREIKVVSLLPALAQELLPAQVLRGNTQSPTPGRAEWLVGSLAGAAGYRAQFASDEKFSQIQSDIKSSTPALDVSALMDGSYYARVRGVDSAGIEGFSASQLIRIQTAALPVPPPLPPISLVWSGKFSVGAVADFTPGGWLVKTNIDSADTVGSVTVQVASDASMGHNLQTLSYAASAKILLSGLPVGQRSYVRFTLTDGQSQRYSSPVLSTLPVTNWGTLVLGTLQPAQALR